MLYTDQLNRIERPEINPCICVQLIYNKGAKICDGERIIPSINIVGKTQQPHAKK